MAIDSRIPLQVQTPQFAPTLSNLVQNRRQNEHRDLQLDLQERGVAAQESRLNAPQPPSEADIGRAYISSAYDATAASELITQGNPREGMRLLMVAEERLNKLGQDTTGFQEVLRLASADPQGAATYINEHITPRLESLMSGEIEEEQTPETFTTEMRNGVPVQVSSSSGREFASPRLGNQADTVVNVNSQGETAATKKFGESIGERAGQRIDLAENALDQNLQLDRASMALERGAETGMGEETLLNLKNFGQTFLGMDFENVPEQEVVRTIQNQMALRLRNPASGLGLTGSTSNRDLQFLKDSVIGLARSEEGNELLIDMMKRQNNLKVDIAAEQNRIIEENGGVVPNNLDSQIMDFVNEYDFFTPEERTTLQLSAERTGEFNAPEISSQEEFDQLPSGSIYIEDGQRFVKP